MKITVSNTSMMKPVLYCEKHSLSSSSHPRRVLGLLEQTNFLSTDNTVSVYNRPTTSGSQPLLQLWHNFMQIPDSRGQPCAAVFGFKFDGHQTWYQIWNVITAKGYWLLHTESMDYKPYAIIAMDALVTLIPGWNGELFLHLTKTQDEGGNKQLKYNLLTRANKQSYELHISDAATTESGQLWFLVTIKDRQKGHKSAAAFDTGWISNSSQVPRAA